MCGLFGYSFPEGKAPPSEQRAVLAHVLADLNDDRGGDSWGRAWLEGGVPVVGRGLGDASKAGFWAAGRHATMAGHTRQATKGAVTEANAHPFHASGEKKILLAHNGQIFNHEALNARRRAAGLEPFECDSRHLVQAVADGGGFDRLNGYGACWWFEETGEGWELKLSRMAGGMLHLLALKDGGVVFSSEREHAEGAAEAAGLDAEGSFGLSDWEVVLVRDGQVFETEEKIHLSRETTLPGWGWEEEPEDEEDEEEEDEDFLGTGLTKQEVRRYVEELGSKQTAEMLGLGNHSAWLLGRI